MHFQVSDSKIIEVKSSTLKQINQHSQKIYKKIKKVNNGSLHNSVMAYVLEITVY